VYPKGTTKHSNGSSTVLILEQVLHVLEQGRRFHGRTDCAQVLESAYSLQPDTAQL